MLWVLTRSEVNMNLQLKKLKTNPAIELLCPETFVILVFWFVYCTKKHPENIKYQHDTG